MEELEQEERASTPKNFIDKRRRFLIANRIQQLRKQQGISQGELADMAGVSRSLIGLIEIGRHKPSLECVIHLSIALGCSMDYLVGKVAEEEDTPDGKMLKAFHDLAPDKQEFFSFMLDKYTKHFPAAPAAGQ